MPKPKAIRYTFLNNNKEYVNNFANVYAQLNGVYGPDGKMPTGIGYDGTKYNNMKLNVPEGISDEVVTALVMGCCLDPKRLNRAMTGSSPGEELTASNQTHIIDNIPKGDKRDGEFGPVLEAGKEEAQQALDAYAKGDPSMLREKLQRFVDYNANSLINSATTNDTHKIPSERSSYMLAAKILANEELGVKPRTATAVQEARMMAFPKAIEALSTSKAQQNELVEKFDQLSQEQKEELTAEMLFNACVATVPTSDVDDLKAKQSDLVFKLFEDMGIDPYEPMMSDPNGYAISGLKFVQETSKKMIEPLGRGTLNDNEAILSKPDGKEQLKALYMDQIKQSDTFKKIVSAKSKDECLDHIIDADRNVIAYGFTKFNVKPQEVGKEIAGEDLKKETNDKTKELQDNMLEKAFAEGGPLNKYNKEYAVEEWSQEAFQKNARVFDAIYNGLNNAKVSGNKSLSPIQNSEDPEYDKIIETAGMMKYEADRCSSVGSIPQNTTLIQNADKFSAAVSKYLKEHQNDETASEKLETLKQAKLMAVTAKISVKKAIEKKTKEIEDQFEATDEKAVDEQRVSNMNTVFGEKYKDQTKRIGKLNFTSDRSAVTSIGIYALATQGYSMDDLLDPEKLKTEKQNICDEIFTHMQSGTAEDNMQIATYLHDGQKYMDDWINKQMKKIDLSDPNCLKTPEFTKLRLGMITGFDCSQERDRCSEEIGQLASKATNGQITTRQQFEAAHNQGPAAPLVKNLDEMKKQASATIMNGEYSDIFNMALASKISTNHIMKDIHRKQQENPGKEYLDLYSHTDTMTMLTTHAYAYGLVKNSEISKYLKNNPQDIERFTKGFITGKFSDVTLSPVPPNDFKLNNFPTVAEAKVLCNDNDKMVSAAIKNAKEAKKGVWGGGNDFDDAIKAMEELEKAQKRIAEMKDDVSDEERRNQIDDAREQARFAQEKIDIYLERKEKEQRENPKKAVDEKTQKRIDAMKASKKAVREQQYDLDDKILEMDRKLVEETNKQYAEEMSSNATAPAAEANAPAKDVTAPEAAPEVKESQNMTMGEFYEWSRNSHGVINADTELDVQSLRDMLHQDMVAKNLAVRHGADKPLNAEDVAAENQFLSGLKPYAETLNSLSKEQLVSCINEPDQFINEINRQLEAQTAQKEQEAPGAQQEGANIEREAVISAQNDSVEKAASEIAGPEPEPMDRVTRVELEDKLAEQTDLMMWDKLDELKNAYNPKLPGKSGLPEGEDENAYFESSKDELADFASKTLAAQLIGNNVKTWQNSVLGKASEEQIKQMNEKSLSNDNILENARLLQESPAFKQMMTGVKTWDDFDKFRDLTNTNYGKQLINELSKNSKQIEKQEEVREAALAAQKTLNAPQKQGLMMG